eukprot:6168606-Amphidinium_carterae.1
MLSNSKRHSVLQQQGMHGHMARQSMLSMEDCFGPPHISNITNVTSRKWRSTSLYCICTRANTSWCPVQNPPPSAVLHRGATHLRQRAREAS